MLKFKPILIQALGLMMSAACGANAAPKPNIVYILADDLGYGDVRLLNPQGKIPTPHMDRLGAGGMIFTDAHSTSSVCSPSRYSILTGRYNWRSAMKHGVLNGYSPRLIENGRMTVAAFLKQAGLPHGLHREVARRHELAAERRERTRQLGESQEN